MKKAKAILNWKKLIEETAVVIDKFSICVVDDFVENNTAYKLFQREFNSMQCVFEEFEVAALSLSDSDISKLEADLIQIKSISEEYVTKYRRDYLPSLEHAFPVIAVHPVIVYHRDDFFATNRVTGFCKYCERSIGIVNRIVSELRRQKNNSNANVEVNLLQVNCFQVNNDVVENDSTDLNHKEEPDSRIPEMEADEGSSQQSRNLILGDMIPELKEFFKRSVEVEGIFDEISWSEFAEHFYEESRPKAKLNYIAGNTIDFGYFILRLDEIFKIQEVGVNFTLWTTEHIMFKGKEVDKDKIRRYKSKAKNSEGQLTVKNKIDFVLSTFIVPQKSPKLSNAKSM